jgi:benzoate-CoA ligase
MPWTIAHELRYDLPDVARNLTLALLDDTLAEGRSEAIAIREPKRVWTYGRLLDEVGRSGTVFRQLGVQPGERVAFFLHDSMELAAGFLGAARIGAVPTPISVLLRPLELRDVLRDSGAVAVVVHADLAPTLEAVRKELPALRQVLAVGGARPAQLDVHALTLEAEPVCEPYQPSDEHAALLLYSAGPRGARKGVAHDHAAPLAAYQSYAHELLHLGTGDRVFTTSSLTSAFGLGLGLIFPLLARCSTFLLPARPRPRIVFDVMGAYKPTVFAATPSLHAQLVHDFRALPAPRPTCFEPIRVAISGGEALPAALAQRFTATFNRPLVHGFGSTEALHFILSNPLDGGREGSVGRPLSGVEARVLGDDGAPVKPHEIGVLEVRAPTVARGYFGHPPDAEHFRDGWLRPGDRFFVDNDGYFFHCGRQDDLFKVSGRWVSPDEVERTLLQHAAVWECAVVEGHDDDGLARPVAFVVPNVGHAPSLALAQDLMGFVKREIAPYKYPRLIEFVDRLPKNAGGRVERWRLRRASATG